jgi:type IV secretion system protein VirB9
MNPFNRTLLVSLTLCAALASAQADPLTPAQLVEQVREQQITSGQPGALAFVPAPSTADIASAAATAASATAVQDPQQRTPAQRQAAHSALKVRQTAEANTQHASETISVKGKMLFTYSEGGIYELQTATFHETAIELQPGEVLTGRDLPTAGDTTRWTVAATRTGMAPNESVVLIVKPLEADLETNMTVTTNRRLYSVILKSNERTYMPLVAWLYPQDEAREQQEQLAHAAQIEAEAEPLAVDPDKLNFNCAIGGSHVPWAPLRVYDDGTKTYLQMSPEMGSFEAPALFVLEKNDPLLVNYRVKHSLYIVDRLFDRAQLRVGAKTAVDIRCTRRVASR